MTAKVDSNNITAPRAITPAGELAVSPKDMFVKFQRITEWAIMDRNLENKKKNK